MLSSLTAIRYNELFGVLREEELFKIASLCSEVSVDEDSMIFTEGRSATHLYIVKEGKVSLQRAVRAPSVKCSRRTTVSFCYPEEILGWSALVDPFKYTLSAVAWEPSRLIKIEASLLRRVLDGNPEMGYRVSNALLSVVSRRLRQSTDSLTNEREYSYYGDNL